MFEFGIRPWINGLFYGYRVEFLLIVIIIRIRELIEEVFIDACLRCIRVDLSYAESGINLMILQRLRSPVEVNVFGVLDPIRR
jgi:hypothetical protein